MNCNSNLWKKLANGKVLLKPAISKFNVKKTGLFGSFAKNKQNYHSDVDVLVKFNSSSFDDYMGLKFLLEKQFKRKVDVVMDNALKPDRLEYIKKDLICA